MNSIHAAIEIGTSRTVLAVGELTDTNRVKIIAHAEIPSVGVRKGQILEIHQIQQSIHSVLANIQRSQQTKDSGLTIGNAFLIISGTHIEATPFRAGVTVNGKKVTLDDIENVIYAAHQMPLPRDREIIDIIDGFYSLDDLEGLADPKGLSGHTLHLDTLHLHANRDRINDARTAAAEAHLETRDPLFAATCAADACLNEYERRNGALILDLGGGTTAYAAYLNGKLATAGVIGVGGDHVDNDIAIAFQTTRTQAETLKIKEGSAIMRARETVNPRVCLPGSSPLIEQRTISRHALDTVINARYRELLAVIREALERTDVFGQIHSEVVLTGGGAAMNGIAQLIQREWGIKVRLGTPIEVDGLENEEHPEAFAAIAGALIYAHRNYKERSMIDTMTDGFRRLFGGSGK